MAFFEKGDVRIRYEELESGFQLLVIPGGGLNFRLSNGPDRGVQRHGGVEGRPPLHHNGSAQCEWWRANRPDCR